MKLSELTTDQSLNVLCEITPFVSNIVTDEEIVETISKGIDTNGMTKMGVLRAAAGRITALIPSLLNAHRGDVYGILAAVNGTTPDKIAKQKLTDTVAQFKETIQDEDLLVFFRSFGPQDKKKPSAPSAKPQD